MPVLTIILIVIFTLFIIGIISSDDEAINNYEKNENNEIQAKRNEVIVIDFSTMSINDITKWCEENKVICNIEQEYSDTVAKDKFISQSIIPNKKIHEQDYITITFSLGKEPSMEYKNALIKAQSYSDNMYMSKKGIYEQLTSEYGEGFEKDAAQYAIDNVKANWKLNALKKAQSYRESMNMSKSAIYEQLISEYGEKFTRNQAQYAIDHLDD